MLPLSYYLQPQARKYRRLDKVTTEITNTDDIIDIRDVIARVEFLEAGGDDIDWDEAVRLLQIDYAYIDFDGVKYWAR